jgi:protein-S-isoprenylcysteine O-methyltransferase
MYCVPQVAIRACGLGLFIVAGLSLAFSSWTCHLLGWYFVVLGIFHWSEYYATAVTNPKNLSLSSYLLDHSLAYHIAVVSGFIEFLLEWYFLPGLYWKFFLTIINNFK